MCSTCKQAVFPTYIDSTLLVLKYHISIKKSSKSKIDKIAHPTHGLCVVKGKPTLESRYAPVAGSSSEEEESLLISIFYLYKEQKYSFKRLAVVTLFTFGVSNFLHVHFHHKFWFISVR